MRYQNQSPRPDLTYQRELLHKKISIAADKKPGHPRVITTQTASESPRWTPMAHLPFRNRYNPQYALSSSRVHQTTHHHPAQLQDHHNPRFLEFRTHKYCNLHLHKLQAQIQHYRPKQQSFKLLNNTSNPSAASTPSCCQFPTQTPSTTLSSRPRHPLPSPA